MVQSTVAQTLVCTQVATVANRYPNNTYVAEIYTQCGALDGRYKICVLQPTPT